jgi:hypothetical protein
MNSSSNAMTGYAHPAFAEVYREFGTARALKNCGGFVLERAIGDTGLHDAMGCYPLFCCRDWSGLRQDTEVLSTDLVSLVLIADPFHAPVQRELGELFDHVVPFKTHYVADLHRPIQQYVSKSRLRGARKALRKITIDIPLNPEALANDWHKLHSEMASRRRLTGITALSTSALERLFRVPGLIVLRATHNGETVGMHVVFLNRDTVYCHFAAYSALGYTLGASTALYVCDIEHFSGKARWIDWGGVPGGGEQPSGSLTYYKQAFASDQRTVYLCGKIFDKIAYHGLLRPLHQTTVPYFPAYRSGEFI